MGAAISLLVAFSIVFAAGLVLSRVGFFKKLVDKGAEFIAKIK